VQEDIEAEHEKQRMEKFKNSNKRYNSTNNLEKGAGTPMPAIHSGSNFYMEQEYIYGKLNDFDLKMKEKQ